MLLVNRYLLVSWLFSIISQCTVNAATESDPDMNKTLVVVPGLSSKTKRIDCVMQNLKLISEYDSNFGCIIHYYNKWALSDEMSTLLKNYGCMLQYFHEHNHYSTYLKSVLPSLVRYGGFKYVMVLLDDVELMPTFRLSGIMDIMRRNQLSVVSPAIHGSTMTSTTPYKHSARAKQFKMPPLYSVGSEVQSIEIFATLFSIDSWECFWDMVEPQWNPAGWGYDLCFFNFCRNRLPKFKMGVVYTMTARHHTEFGRIERSALFGDLSTKYPGIQYNFWVKEMQEKRNITLVPVMKNSRGKKLS